MKEFLYKYRHASLFSLFLVLLSLYYIPQWFCTLDYNVIHIPFDDIIPFVPVFIVPYCLWYLYIPLPMIYACFKDKRTFYLQVVTLFSGAFICTLFFYIYPSCVAFRPDTFNGDIFSAICRMIFDADKPINVFPSLHCYEATAIYLSTFHGGFLKKNKALRVCAFILLVLICISTVLVKQHSTIDLLVGCLLAVSVYFIVSKLFFKVGHYADS